MGGAGSAVGEALSQIALAPLPLLHLGLPDEFIEHGDPAVLMSQLGLDAAGIEKSIRTRFGTWPAHRLFLAWSTVLMNQVGCRFFPDCSQNHNFPLAFHWSQWLLVHLAS
jgi:hypothetical protein